MSDPNSGTVVDAAQSRAGSIDTKCTARVSPGSAPSTWNGPVCGFTSFMFRTSDGRSVVRCSRPEKASSVQSFSAVPGLIRWVGATPPKVQAYWSGEGRNSTTSTGEIVSGSAAGRKPSILAPVGRP